MIMRAEHTADFVSIQNDAIRDDRLSLAARGLLVYMLSMSDGWGFSVSGLVQALKISRPTLIRYLKELQDAGYVSITKEQNKLGQFSGKSWTVYETPKSHSKENRTTENLTTVNHSQKNRTTEFLPLRTTKYKNNQNTKSNTRTRTREKFTPPTLEDVTAYCQERQNNVDPQRWLDYYTANGWRVGKNPMKDWKAAVRTWERSGYNNAPRKPAPHPGQNPATAEQSKIDEALRIALQRAEGGAV